MSVVSTREQREEVARNLRRLMDVRGLTPKALCWLLGYGPERMQTIKGWLSAEVMPSPMSISMLCVSLECEECEILGR